MYSTKKAMSKIRDHLMSNILPDSKYIEKLNNSFASLKKQLSTEKRSLISDKIIYAFLRFRKLIAYSFRSKETLTSRIEAKKNKIAALQRNIVPLSQCTSALTLFGKSIKPVKIKIQDQ